jgi:hypothetical protein
LRYNLNIFPTAHSFLINYFFENVNIVYQLLSKCGKLVKNLWKTFFIQPQKLTIRP